MGEGAAGVGVGVLLRALVGAAGLAREVAGSGALGLGFWLGEGFGGAVAAAGWVHVREALTAAEAMFWVEEVTCTGQRCLKTWLR